MPINPLAQRKDFRVVISDLERCDGNIQDALTGLVENGYNYYAIVHDSDIDTKTLLPKRTHLHIVLTRFKRIQAKKVIADLCDLFQTNDSNVQIMDCPDIPSAVQYLTHKRDPNKYQYDFNKIMTNQRKEQLTAIYEQDLSVYILTTEGLIEAVQSSNNRYDLIKRIGIGNYQAYRQTINDLIDFLGVDY